MKTLPLLALLGLLAGCASNPKLDLPAITARDLIVSHQNPLFNVSLTAENLEDHGSYITADKLIYQRGGKFTATSIRVEGYRRDKSTNAP